MSEVAVLMGGWSAEREVSLVSGQAVARALADRGHDVRPIDVTRNPARLVAALTPHPEVVFNALHGTGGEDGVIQGLMDMMGLRYTHSGRAASAVAMDKPLTKRLLAGAGVRSPEGRVCSRADILAGPPLPPPFVVKPAAEGSSVGVHIIRPGDNYAPVLQADWPHGDHLLVERYIPGRELTVAVMGRSDGEARPLTVTEIRPAQGFYDYQAKYTEGRAAHVLPAEIPADIFDAAMELAARAHRALGCGGVSRSDFRWNPEEGAEGLYFLEINTQPGMTPLSLVPEQAAHLGMDFGSLVDWLVENAECHA